ncbi:wolframin isoform X2 [Aplysia californica]|uniref:Wolframin isoform X2 n=1 Tax=Aplysia californica TaxID=6500 RepID=A0ABM0JB46_APLCA|nr:wolframin isoform X2 [Aplysia californica]
MADSQASAKAEATDQSDQTDQPSSSPAPEVEKISDEVLQSWIKEAEDGSEKHQLQLGSHYLKLAEVDIEKEDNAASAVKWLISASRQGNEEATEKLRHCAQTELGITDVNKNEVKWCLNTSAPEKKVRFAAKSLFSKLNSAHKGALSKEEYVEAINKLTAGHEKERKLLLAAGRKIGSTITENDFVKTLSKKIQGTLTLTVDEMDEKSADYDSSGYLRKVFVYPKQTAQIAFDQGLEFASKEGMNVIVSLIPTNQIYLLAMVFAYSFLTPQLLLLVVPLFVFYISALVLIISTLQMFYKKRKQRDATSLAHLLQENFDMELDVNSTDSQYSWNSLTPYIVFFTALPLMVTAFSLANKAHIPCAEMFMVSLVMTGFCFVGLSDSHDSLTFLALASHAFASLPVFLAQAPRIPFLTAAVEFFIQPFVSLDLGLGFTFNISLPAVVHLLIPVLLMRMAMRDSWSGTYRIVIPHLVCFFWFSISTVVFPFTTFYGLARATVGYLMLPILVPLGMVFFMLGLLYLFYQLLMTQMIGKLVVTGLLLSVPLLLSQTKTLFGKKKEGKTSPKMQKIKKGVMIGFSVLAVVPLLFVQIPALTEKAVIDLPWEEYKGLCLPGENEISAPFQIRCRDFVGTRVTWAGVVKEVKVTKVENTAESVIKSLPSFLADPLYCIYGSPIGECNAETMPEKALKHCQLVTATGRTCHLRDHNQISLSLSVQVEDVTVNLDASANFQNRLMALVPGDELQFTGSLADIGTRAPLLKLKSMTCTNRDLPVMAETGDEFDEDVVYKMMNEALALTFNFGFFPVIKYSPY